MKQLALIIFLSLVSLSAVQAQRDPAPVLRKIADRIIGETTYRFTDSRTHQSYANLAGVPFSLDMKVDSRYNDWHYTNGVLDIAMLELAKALDDTAYSGYVKRNMDFVFDTSNLNYFRRQYQTVLKGPDGLNRVSRYSWYMFFRMIRLDDYGTMAASLVDLYRQDPNPAFKQYFERSAHTLEYAEPRLPDGTIARYFPHKMTLWADDLYMSVSLLARMGALTGDKKYFDDAVKQVLQFHKYLWDPYKEIYYHCYYTDSRHHGVAYWGRCNGWIMMAEADLLSVLPENYPGRDKVLGVFRLQAEGLARYQSATGLWHQLLDKTDSYLETSCTAMFTFSLARGVNRGWLEPDFAQVAYAGWKGLLTKISDAGDVSSICPGTGISPSTVAYYERPERKNLAMGEAPVLRAGIEMMTLKPYREEPAWKSYHLVKDRSKKK
jgi:rhamnogalacturonyl hydrolase YesR